MNRRSQSGDPAKLAQALLTIAGQKLGAPLHRRRRRHCSAEQKVADLKAQIEANRDLSTSLAFES